MLSGHGEAHYQMVKRVLRYVHGTTRLGLSVISDVPWQFDVILGRRLGWVPRHPQIYVWLCSVPRLQPRQLVVEMPEHCLAIER